MIAARIEGFTREMAKDQPEFARLCIRDEPVVIEGWVTPFNAMVSAWEPTPQELALLNAGGKVYLRIVGSGHPPVAIWAEGPPPVVLSDLAQWIAENGAAGMPALHRTHPDAICIAVNPHDFECPACKARGADLAKPCEGPR
jgi:hypothetical protein